MVSTAGGEHPTHGSREQSQRKKCASWSLLLRHCAAGGFDVLGAESMLVEQVLLGRDFAKLVGNAKPFDRHRKGLGQHFTDRTAKTADDALVVNGDDRLRLACGRNDVLGRERFHGRAV